jgi:tape measure domain-containing protein
MSDDVKFKVVSDSTQAQADLKKLSASVKNIEKVATDTTRNLALLAKSVTAAFAGVAALQSLNKSVDALTNLENRIALVTGRTKELIYVQDQLVKVSLRTRSTLDGSAEIYTTFAKSVDKSTSSMEDLLEVTEAVQKAVAISGVTADSAKAALMQLGQGLQSGVLRGEELNSVLEQTPRIAKAIADGLGLSLAQMRALAAEGQLTSDRVFGALKSQTAKLNQEFKQMEPTFSQGAAVLKDAAKRFTGEMGRGLGITNSMAKVMFQAAQAVQDRANFIQFDAFIFASRAREAVYDAITVGRSFKEVFDAIGVQVQRMIPQVVGFGLGFLRSFNLFGQSITALIADPLNRSIKITRTFTRSIFEALGLWTLFGDSRIARTVQDIFRVDSLSQFVSKMHELANLIKDTRGDGLLGLFNPTSTRNFTTKLLDATPGIRAFSNEVRKSMINLGLIEGPLFLIGNLRFDKLRSGFEDVRKSISRVVTFVAQPFIYPIINQFKLLMFSLGSIIGETGDNLGGVFGKLLIGIGHVIENASTIWFSPIVRFVQFLDSSITKGLENTIDAIKSPLTIIGDLFEKMNTLIFGSFLSTDNLISGLAKSISSGISFIVDKGREFLAWLNDLVNAEKIFSDLQDAIGKPVRAIVSYLKDLFTVAAHWQLTLKDLFNPKMLSFKAFVLNESLGSVLETVASLVGGAILLGMTNGFGAFALMVNHYLGGMLIANAIGSAFKSIRFDSLNGIEKFIERVGKVDKGLAKSLRNTYEFTVGIWGKLGAQVNKAIDKLEPALAAVKRFCDHVSKAFYDVWDKVVGHSYWPDTIKGIVDWSKKLGTDAWSTIKNFCDQVAKSFYHVYDSIIRSGMWQKLVDKINNVKFDKAVDKFRLFGEKVKEVFSSAGKFVKSHNIEDLKMPVARAANPIKEMLANLTLEDVTKAARVLAVGVVGAIFIAIASPATQLAVLAYVSKGIAESIFKGLNLVSDGKAGYAIASEIGTALGQAVGLFFRNFIEGIPTIVNALVNAASAFGSAFLDQFGIIGSSIKGLLKIAGFGEDGLLGAILFGVGAHFVMDKLGIANKAIKGIFEMFSSKKQGATGGGGSGGSLLEQMFTGTRGKALLAGSAIIISGFTDQVNAAQASLGIPLVLYAILGPEGAARLITTTLSSVLNIALTMINSATAKLAGRGLFEKLFGLDSGNALRAVNGVTEKIRTVAGRVFDQVNKVVSEEHRKAYADKKMNFREYLFGDIFKSGIPSGSSYDDFYKTKPVGTQLGLDFDGTSPRRPQLQAELDFGTTETKKATKGLMDYIKAMPGYFRTLFYGANGNRATVIADAVTTAQAASGAANAVSSSAAAGGGFFSKLFGSSAIAGTISGLSEKASDVFKKLGDKAAEVGGKNGIIGKYLFGKTGLAIGIIALLTLISSNVQAATSAGTAAASNSIGIFDTILMKLNDFLGILGIAGLFAAIMPASGWAYITAGLTKIGSMLLAFVASGFGIGLAIAGGVGLIGVMLFGEGNTLSDKIDNVSTRIAKKFGFLNWDTMGSKQKELNRKLPNQSIGEIQVDFKEKFAKINYATIDPKNFAAIERLVDRTAELAKKADEESRETSKVSAETSKELTRSMDMLTKAIDRNSATNKGLDYDKLSRAIIDAFDRDRRQYLPETKLNRNDGMFQALNRVPVLNTALEAIVQIFERVPVLFNSAVKVFDKNPNDKSYRDRRENFSVADSEFRSIAPFLDKTQLTQYEEELNKLNNAIEQVDNTKKKLFFTFGFFGNTLKKDREALGNAITDYDRLQGKLVQLGLRKKQIAEFQGGLKSLNEVLKDTGIDVDLNDLYRIDTDTLANVTLLADLLKKARTELATAGTSNESNAAQQIVDDLTKQLTDRLEEGKVSNNLSKSLELMVSKAGIQVDINDLLKLPETDLAHVQQYLRSIALQKERIANFKIGDDFNEIRKSMQIAAEATKKFEEHLRNSRSSTENLINDLSKLGTQVDKYQLALGSDQDRSRISSNTAELVALEKQFEEVTNQKDSLERDLNNTNTPEASAQAMKAQIRVLDSTLGEISRRRVALQEEGKRLVESFNFKDVVSLFNDSVSKSGISLDLDSLLKGSKETADQLFGLMQVSYKAKLALSQLGKKVDKDTGVVIFSDFEKAAGYQEEIRSASELAESLKKSFTQRFSEGFSNLGINFDMSRSFEIDAKTRSSIEEAAINLRNLKKERDKLASNQLGLFADDSVALNKLNKDIDEVENKLRKLFDTNLAARLSNFANVTGTQISEKLFSSLDKNARTELDAIYKDINDLNNKKKELEVIKPNSFELINDVEYKKTIDKLEALRVKANSIITGEIPSMAARAGVEIDMKIVTEVDPIQRLILRKELDDLIKKNEQLSEVMRGVTFENLTPEVIARLKELNKEINQGKFNVEEFSTITARELKDISKILDKAGTNIDTMALAGFSPEKLKIITESAHRIVRLKNQLSLLEVSDFNTRQKVLDSLNKEFEMIKEINKAQERKNQLAEDFVGSGKTFLSELFTGNAKDAFRGLLDSVTGSIVDTFTTQLADILFKDLGKSFGDLFGDLFGIGATADGTTAARAMYVRVVNAVGGLFGNDGIGDPAKALNDPIELVQQKISGFFDELTGGFGEVFVDLFSVIRSMSGGGGGSNAFGSLMSIGSAIFGGMSGGGFGTGSAFGNLDYGGFFDEGGVVPGSLGSPKLAVVHSGETILPTHKKDITMGNQQVINISITGDISRQTKSEIMKMVPQIAAGVNQHNYEQGIRR